MKRKIRTLLTLLFIPLLHLFAQHSLTPADLILFNGKIITVDRNFTIAAAIAIKKDKILAVGTNKEIKKLSGHNTKIIDLGGKTVVPGLIDFHTHLDVAAVSE